jgi:hypothetical protein
MSCFFWHSDGNHPSRFSLRHAQIDVTTIRTRETAITMAITAGVKKKPHEML